MSLFSQLDGVCLFVDDEKQFLCNFRHFLGVVLHVEVLCLLEQ